MALSIKQIQAFNLVVMRIAGGLEYLQQFVKLVRAFAYTEGSQRPDEEDCRRGHAPRQSLHGTEKPGADVPKVRLRSGNAGGSAVAVEYQAELWLKKLGLESLASLLKIANEAVRTLMAQRNDERMYQEKAALATACKQADEAYHDFVTMLNAAALIDEDGYTYDELIQQINELIKYYRQYVVPRIEVGGRGRRF